MQLNWHAGQHIYVVNSYRLIANEAFCNANRPLPLFVISVDPCKSLITIDHFFKDNRPAFIIKGIPQKSKSLLKYF